MCLFFRKERNIFYFSSHLKIVWKVILVSRNLILLFFVILLLFIFFLLFLASILCVFFNYCSWINYSKSTFSTEDNIRCSSWSATDVNNSHCSSWIFFPPDSILLFFFLSPQIFAFSRRFSSLALLIMLILNFFLLRNGKKSLHLPQTEQNIH